MKSACSKIRQLAEGCTAEQLASDFELMKLHSKYFHTATRVHEKVYENLQPFSDFVEAQRLYLLVCDAMSVRFISGK